MPGGQRPILIDHRAYYKYNEVQHSIQPHPNLLQNVHHEHLPHQ